MKQFDWERFYTFTKDRPPWPRLEKAVSLLAHKEYALDLGYGAGRDTRYLLGQGFYVTAVDSDPHAIALLADLPQDRLRAVQSSCQYLTPYWERLVSELHRNSAYLLRRAALVSASDTSGRTDKTPVLTQSCRIRNVRITILRAPTRSACSV